MKSGTVSAQPSGTTPGGGGGGIYFTDVFDVAPEKLEAYGAFNVSLINDLPMFVDPFLLFNSKDAEYQALHESIIRYVRFLRRWWKS